MTIQTSWLSLIGRILLAAIFLLSGINKIADPQGTQQYMASMGMTWLTGLFYVGAILVEVGGGLSLLLGYRARIGAWLLIAFMIPTTLIFHANLGDQNQMIHFLKNLSMIGGLLYVAVYGAGGLSMDAGLERTERAPVSDRPAMKKVINR
ncbi:DoxX family protein [Nitrospira moscoviensis]|uniref:DoxX family protein n=1 Tax=Nitrospira moscoviensis TaxID=42253 RepID=A0A0K2GEJ3_NITMO|nr:DoxX family protein [Nitrospira moscoviensis]ALA59017.1 DoxX family protein [Nitrospira moscoviensis]